MRLSLVVIRCREADIDVMKRFYETLGVTLHQEQHGSGPIHFSSTNLIDLVLELYPTKKAATQRLMLGFVVRNLDAVLRELRNLNIEARYEPCDDGWGRHTVVLDHAGNTIDLTEEKVTTG